MSLQSVDKHPTKKAVTPMWWFLLLRGKAAREKAYIVWEVRQREGGGKISNNDIILRQ